jgi:hypothetical protein
MADSPADNPIIPPNTVKPMTEGELSVAFAGPAFHVNKMFASNMATGVRLSFCEMRTPDGHDLQFRTAVVISYIDATALRDLLNRQLEGVQFVEIPQGEKIKNG